MKYEAHELEEELKKRDTNLDVCGIENLSDAPTNIYLLIQIGTAPTLETE